MSFMFLFIKINNINLIKQDSRMTSQPASTPSAAAGAFFASIVTLAQAASASSDTDSNYRPPGETGPEVADKIVHCLQMEIGQRAELTRIQEKQLLVAADQGSSQSRQADSPADTISDDSQ